MKKPRFGKKTENLHAIDGQISFFDEADVCYNCVAIVSTTEEIFSKRTKKKKGREILN